jgi:hypothetical protein
MMLLLLLEAGGEHSPEFVSNRRPELESTQGRTLAQVHIHYLYLACFTAKLILSQVTLPPAAPSEAQTERRRSENATEPTFLCARQPYHEPSVARHDLGRMDVPCQYCGALYWEAEKLSNSPKSSPLFACCSSGYVRTSQSTYTPSLFSENLNSKFYNFKYQQLKLTSAPHRRTFCVIYHSNK